MEMKKEDMIHLANLSMLNLTDTEIERYTEDMKGIIGFANTINEIDTDGIDISAFALDTCNVFRKDEVKESFDRDQLLQNAPSSNGEMYSIPNVME